jgi:hypothetical protein
MKKWQLAIAVSVFAIAILALPQDVKHAPTLQSCIGDINLWSSQISGFPEPSYDQVRGGTKSLTMHEIDGRRESMGDCVSAYPVLGKGKSGDLSAVMSLSSYYGTEVEMRYVDFLNRHGLLTKLNEEDKAGQR